VSLTADEAHLARSRFINAINRFLSGARTQRARILEREANAPRLLEGEPYEVINLTGDPGSDLDYYIYELVRLQDAAHEINTTFDSPPAVVDALERFDRIVPGVRRIRNPLTHASNDERLDDVAWFSSVVRLGTDGSVETLVDPRHAHHEAAEALAAALLLHLREGLRAG
jgi:hypothetical protein